MNAGPSTVLEIFSEHAFNKCRAGLLRSSQTVYSCQQVFRQCDGSLLFHTTIILLSCAWALLSTLQLWTLRLHPFSHFRISIFQFRPLLVWALLWQKFSRLLSAAPP